MINKKECLNKKMKMTEDLKDRMNKNKKEWLFKMNNKIEDLKDKIKVAFSFLFFVKGPTI
jgi:hypothetical protein